MYYVTGDTHGDFSRVERFCERFKPVRDDVMIILGDAGFNYYGGKRDQRVKQRMSEMPLTIFSIYGNHEMRPGKIPSYHLAQWHGGTVFVEDAYPNLLFAVDGEVYDMDGHQTIAIGGAYSVDKYYRLEKGWNWWPDEQPTPEIKKGIEKVLDYCGWKVDAVLSHNTPTVPENRA
ncbi:MAG: metallophosphoesterase [Clostridia bacterium]|nr:metallophosphoesterase [Clostridia bacterium]